MPKEINKSNADYNMGAYDAIDSVMLAVESTDMTREEIIVAMREVQLAAATRISELAEVKH